MAAIVEENSSKNINIQDYACFKANIASKLDWRLSDWEENHLSGTNLHFFTKNIKFWFKSLPEAQYKKYIVLTSYSASVKKKLSMLQISLALKKQFGFGILDGISESVNRNFVVLFVQSDEMRKKIVDEFCVVGSHFIVTSDWLSPVKQIDFAVNWLPPDIALEDVHLEISKYAVVSSIKKLCLDLGDGDFQSTGKIIGTLNIAMLPSLESFPHLLSIAGFRAHWIIYLRQPLCLACRSIGHMANSCPTPYCSSCRSLAPRDHKCSVRIQNVSYAAVLKVPDISQLAAVESTKEELLLIVPEVPAVSVHNLVDKVEIGKLLPACPAFANAEVSSQLSDKILEEGTVGLVDSVSGKIQGSENMDIQFETTKRSFSQMQSSSGVLGDVSKVVTYSKKNPIKLKAQIPSSPFNEDNVFS